MSLLKSRTFAVSFIMIYLYIIVVFAFPIELELVNQMRNFIRPFTVSMALNQRWSMFSANPAKESLQLYAIIHHKDGRQSTVIFPTVSSNYFRSLISERWRKYREFIRLDKNSRGWDELSDYYIRQIPEDQRNDLVKIELWRAWLETPAPANAHLLQGFKKEDFITSKNWRRMQFNAHDLN